MWSRKILAIKLLFLCTTVIAWEENKGKTKGRTIISEIFCCLAQTKQTKHHPQGNTWKRKGTLRLSARPIFRRYSRCTCQVKHPIFVFVSIKEAMYKTPLDLTDPLSLGGVGLAGPYLTPSVSFPITLTNPPNSKGQSAGTRIFFSLGITKSSLSNWHYC